MKAFEIGPQQGLASLRATTRPEPVAGPGQVLIAPRLVSLISRDVQILRGTYAAGQSAQRIPVSEGVGRVVAIGEGVTQVAVGDRVVCGHFADWIDGPFSPAIFGHDIGATHDGWLAERVLLPAKSVIKVPPSVPDEDVAGLASAGLTAWNALVNLCQVKPGELVLCLGTGGVALAALKLAKVLGARVAMTSSSDAKLALVRELGADITVNYRTNPDWAAELVAQTGGAGADIVIETGGQDTLGQSIAATAVNGRIVVVGLTPGVKHAIPDYLRFVTHNITIRGIANGSRSMMVDLLAAVETHAIKTVVSKTFAFDDAPHAYQYFAAAKHVGKVMIAF